MTLTRLFDIPYHQQKNYPQEDMLVQIPSADEYVKYSTDQVIDYMNQVSAGLLALDVQFGDKIAIVSSNRPEWNFIDLGTQQIGGVTVPIYTNVSDDDFEHIFNDAQIRYAFLENKLLAMRLQSLQDKLPTLEGIYTLEEVKDLPLWKTMLKKPSEDELKEIEQRKGDILEDTLATLVYTSGTTGKPKGVMLNHKNILSNAKACLKLIPANENHRALSFLPLNHVFERMLNYLYMAGGISVYYAQNIGTISRDIKAVNPHIFTTVPRVMEKIYEKIVQKGNELPTVQQKIFFWALGLAEKFDLRSKGWWYKQQLKLADKLIFSKWREALGENLICIVSGGAALNEHINRVFHAAGITILEGYGLTETAPVISVNRYEVDQREIGTVGPPIEEVIVKIAEDGEILCQGPNVTQGYYNLEEQTKEVMKDGWFHTGDVGTLENGFLKITDRKKSMFKTSGGKYIAPTVIENIMKEEPLIAEMVVIGEGKKMVTALVLPEFENLKNWCQKQDIPCGSNEEMINNEAVKNHYQKIINQKNKRLGQTEKVKKFCLIGDDWSQQSGELTPTLKVKRPVVKDKYEDLIEDMYGDSFGNGRRKNKAKASA